MLAKLIFKSLLINLQMQIPQSQKPAKVTFKRQLEPFPFQKSGCWNKQQQQKNPTNNKNFSEWFKFFDVVLCTIRLSAFMNFIQATVSSQNFLYTLDKAQHQNSTYKSLEIRKHSHSPGNPLEKYEQNKLWIQNQQIF